jgi:hypothetical protein
VLSIRATGECLGGFEPWTTCFAAAGETPSPGIEPATDTPGLRTILSFFFFFFFFFFPARPTPWSTETMRQIQRVSNPGKGYRTDTSQRGPATAYLAPASCRAHITSRDVGATLNRTRTEHTDIRGRETAAAMQQDARNKPARDNPLQLRTEATPVQEPPRATAQYVYYAYAYAPKVRPRGPNRRYRRPPVASAGNGRLSPTRPSERPRGRGAHAADDSIPAVSRVSHALFLCPQSPPHSTLDPPLPQVLVTAGGRRFSPGEAAQ